MKFPELKIIEKVPGDRTKDQRRDQKLNKLFN